MKKFLKLLLCCVAVSFCAVNANADPVTYLFTNISANNVADALAGEAQLSVTVSDYAAGQVLFTFDNVGSAAMSITDVYFEDGTLLGIAALIDADENSGDAGVDFSEPATPGNLPSANNAPGAPFKTKSAPGAQFSADSDPEVMPNGVNPGESLGIIVSVSGSFQDVIDAISRGMDPWTYYDTVAKEWTDDHIRIGIHVQGFTGGGSESFVNTPIPAPGAALLGVLGLGMLGWVRRRVA